MRQMTENEKLCVTCGKGSDGQPRSFSHYENLGTPEPTPRFNCYECSPGYAKMMAVKKEENL